MLLFDFHSSLHKQLRLNERFIKRKLPFSLFIHPHGKINVLVVTEYLINMQNSIKQRRHFEKSYAMVYIPILEIFVLVCGSPVNQRYITM